MKAIDRLRDQQQMSWEDISDQIEREVCRSEERQFKDSAFFKRKWPWHKCKRAYYAWRQIPAEEGRSDIEDRDAASS